MLGPIGEEDTTNSLISLRKGLALRLSIRRTWAGSPRGGQEDVCDYTDDTRKHQKKHGSKCVKSAIRHNCARLLCMISDQRVRKPVHLIVYRNSVAVKL